MDLFDVEALVKQGESQTVEFKASTGQLRRAFETLCGFLNTEGGNVVIGVNQDGTIVGQEVADKTKQKIAGRLGNLEPVAPVNVDYVPLPEDDSCFIIVLSVDEGGEHKPFVYDGRPWERVETVTQKMSQEKYERLLIERERHQIRWESELAEGYTLDDLDMDEILKTRRLGIENNRLPESAENDPVKILERLGLIEDGQLLNAGVVLYGNDVLPHYAQLELKMACFKGTDKSEFIDNKVVQGHAFKLLEEGMMFQRRHLPIAGTIPDDSLVREDKPLYPVKALREALVNAICHRDYREPGGSIGLAIFDDRLEITSFGSLPGDLQAEQLKQDHKSILRNRLIAGAFYMRGLVEKWGRGTQDMVQLCVDEGQPEPEFSEEPGPFVQVTFRVEKSVKTESIDMELDDDQKTIVDTVKQKGRITTKEVERLIGKTHRTAFNKLKSLEEAGILEKVADSGTDPTGHYRLK